MPRVRALTLSYVNNQLVEEGWEGHVDSKEIGKNFQILDENAKKAQEKAALPVDVERLVLAARMKAAARGAESTDDVGAVDLRDVIKDLGDAKPAQEVIDAAAKALGLPVASAASVA